MSKELIKAEEKNIYIEKGIKALAYAKRIVVTKDNAVKVKEILLRGKTTENEIEKKRIIWKKPSLDEGNMIDGIAKKLKKPFKEFREILDDKLNKFKDKQEQDIKKAEERARKKHEEEELALEEEKEEMRQDGITEDEIEAFEEDKKEEIIETVNEIIPEKVDIGGRKTIAWDIPDEEKVERDLCSSDKVKINAYKKRNKESIEVYLKKEKEFIVGGIRYFYQTKH